MLYHCSDACRPLATEKSFLVSPKNFRPTGTKQTSLAKNSMTWNKQDSVSHSPSISGMFMTLALFVVSVAIAIVVSPIANYYFYIGQFPGSEERSTILANLKDDAWGLVLSSVCGSVLALLTIIMMRFGRYVATLATQLELIVVYTALSLLATWIMWSRNPTTNPTILTMLPFFIYQISAYLVLEFAALLGHGGRIVYNFVSLGAILGAFIGIIRSIEQAYFYFGASNPLKMDVELGLAFAHSILDSFFFFGTCCLTSACIARSKAGGAFLWHIIALVVPVALACAFSTYVQLANHVPMISSNVARYIVAAVVATAANLLAIGVFWPMRKLNQQHVAQGHKRATGVARGPMAVNAVVIV